jgi:hypothetical protein
MRAGAALEVTATVSRRGKVTDRALVRVEFFSPGQPAGAEPYRIAPATFDPGLHRWVALVSSRGWPPGTWRYRVVAENAGTAAGENLRGGSGDIAFDLTA